MQQMASPGWRYLTWFAFLLTAFGASDARAQTLPFDGSGTDGHVAASFVRVDLRNVHDLLGLRVRQPLTPDIGIEGFGAASVGDDERRGFENGILRLSLQHTLHAFSEDVEEGAWAFGYDLGATRYDPGRSQLGFHLEFWSKLRVVGTLRRNVALGLRGGAAYVRTPTGRYTDLAHGFGLQATWHPVTFGIDFQRNTPATFGSEDVLVVTLGLRR